MFIPSREIRLLIDLLQESYRSKAWHGPNLRGSLRGLTARQASLRPARGRHNIWEIVVHCSYWKYIVGRRIRGEKKGTFYLRGSDWFQVGHSALEWKRDLAMLEHYHKILVDTARELSSSSLSRAPRTSKFTKGEILRGIASHDVYHTGQIQLLKKMIRKRNV